MITWPAAPTRSAAAQRKARARSPARKSGMRRNWSGDTNPARPSEAGPKSLSAPRVPTTTSAAAGARVGEREPALLAAEHGPALVAGERGGEAADREKHPALRGQRLADRACEGRRQRLAAEDAARVRLDDRGPGRGRRRRQRDAPAVGAPPRLDAG